eukprot:scaffold137805_cov142-Phaeocystis_antarctica.AAC.1
MLDAERGVVHVVGCCVYAHPPPPRLVTIETPRQVKRHGLSRRALQRYESGVGCRPARRCSS